VTPAADAYPDLVAQVLAAERGGLDVVGIQDHPYQRRFLDTFALIADLLARTSRLRFFPDVANLPLRPPTMLAKAAASLDVMSGGRFELGIGAGSFWDAVAGMGGPRRSPSEAADALEEAIPIFQREIDRERRENLLILASAGEVWVSPHDRPLELDELYAAIAGADGIVAMLHDRVDDAFLGAAGSDLQVVAFNKKQIAAEKIPNSWEGFLREEFSGRKFMLDIRPKDVAALVPAILYYVALFIQVDLLAARNGLRGLPSSEFRMLAESKKAKSISPRWSAAAIWFSSLNSFSMMTSTCGVRPTCVPQ